MARSKAMDALLNPILNENPITIQAAPGDEGQVTIDG